jgi:SAM-dependent methyltransferase
MIPFLVAFNPDRRFFGHLLPCHRHAPVDFRQLVIRTEGAAASDTLAVGRAGLPAALFTGNHVPRFFRCSHQGSCRLRIPEVKGGWVGNLYPVGQVQYDRRRMNPSNPDEIDWNRIWKQRQELHESSKVSEDTSHNWNKKENAERYDRNARSGYDDRVRTTIAALDITGDSRVLDIGAGPGTLAIPLAPRVKEITAVEPGAGMVEILTRRAEQDGIRNIRCVQKLWEDVDPARDLAAPYDIVIASLSLTMFDIRESLAKMDMVSSGSVHLFWFADMPFWEKMSADLQEPLHGRPYYPGPKADCLFGVLYQMGVLPDVTMLPMAKEYRFSSKEEMFAFFRKRFGAKTPEQERIVDEYVRPLIQKQGDEVVISGDSTFAHVRWKATGRNERR